MHSSQLVAILKTFSKKDIRAFKKWLISPFHNKRDDVYHLFTYLIKNDHLNKPDVITKERAFKVIFPKENYDDAKMRQTMHFLRKQVEAFLIYCEQQSEGLKNQITLLKALRKRQINKTAEKIITQIDHQLKHYPHRDFNFLWNQYLYQQELYEYRSELGKKRSVKFNLQELVDALDTAYFANKIKQSCLMLQHKRVFKTQYDEGMIEEILRYIDEKELLKVPAVALYYYVYNTYPERDSPDNFYRLKDAIYKYASFFPQDEIRDILQLSIYYCFEKFNKGKDGFIKDSFELYRYGIENEILIQNNTISRWDFMNIARAGKVLKEFKWTKSFIDDYQIYLNPKDKDNIVHFCKAQLYFEEGNFDTTITELSQVKENDVLINLSSKSLLLKIYYLKDEYEVLESLFDSMSKYIKRKDVPENYKVAYDSIIKMTKKLVRINLYDKEEIKKLKLQIESTKTLPSYARDWLLTQVKELI